MLKMLFMTDDDLGSFVLRLFLGGVIFPHGMQKLTTLFGGQGFSATMESMMNRLDIPGLVAFLVIMAEGIGWIALILGALTRVAAFGIASNMAGAIFLVHMQHGFLMNWSGTKNGEGYEYHLLVIAICAALMTRGAGKWSVDRAISRRYD